MSTERERLRANVLDCIEDTIADPDYDTDMATDDILALLASDRGAPDAERWQGGVWTSGWKDGDPEARWIEWSDDLFKTEDAAREHHRVVRKVAVYFDTPESEDT